MSLLLPFTVAKGGDSIGSNTSSPADTTGLTSFFAVVQGGFPAGFSDSQSNTWTDCGAGYVEGGTGSGVRIYYCVNPSTSASHTFTGGGTAGRFVVFGVTGAAASPIDAYRTVSAGSRTSLSFSSLTPANDGSLLLFGLYANTNATVTYDSGFTNDDASGTVIWVRAAHLIQSSRAAVTPGASWSGSAASSGILLAIKPEPPPSPAVMVSYPSRTFGRLAVAAY